MHLQFVGCGDAFGSGGRLATCFHVVGAGANFLIDCGASSLIGLNRLGIARETIDAILVTHFHGDHFGGLPYFVLDAHFGKRGRPLVVAGPPGIDSWLVRAMEAAFEHFSKITLGFELRERRHRRQVQWRDTALVTSVPRMLRGPPAPQPQSRRSTLYGHVS